MGTHESVGIFYKKTDKRCENAPLLEHGREPPGQRKKDGAAAGSLFGRTQGQSTGWMGSDDRGGVG
ncbi:MAG: hypothetical protein U0571_12165 [Candidatus Brocadia sapporoensis]|nr:MAG: hypothetical protein CV082_03025 [Candidatus Brocadia sp. BL1]